MNQREKFEAWAKSKGLIQESHGMRSEGSHSATGWEAWQAAIAAQEPKQAMSDAEIVTLWKHHAYGDEPEHSVVVDFARAITNRTSPNNELVEALQMFLNCEGSFGKRVDAVNKAHAALRAAGVEVS